MNFRKTSIIAIMAALTAPAFAQTTIVSSSAATRTVDTITRGITLTELGRKTGLSFTRLFGQSDLYFPVPEAEALQSAILTLDFSSGATLDSDRYLQISVGGQIAKVFDLTEMPSSGQIELEVDTSRATGGFLQISLLYSGGANELVCLDQRSSGDFLSIAETSMLHLALNPKHLDTPQEIMRMQPPRTRISLPDGALSPSVLTAALKAGTLFDADAGQVIFGGAVADTGSEWAQAHVAIASDGPETDFQSTLQAGSFERRPALTILGRDPQQAIEVLAATELAGFASSSTLSSNGLNATQSSGDAVSFGALGFDLPTQYSSGTATFDFTFDIAKLPQGTRPGSISLLVAAARGTDRESTGDVAVATFLNDTLLGSEVLSDSAPSWLEFDIPEGLESRDNLLRVQVLRQPRGGACLYAPQALPAQILPGSSINLETTTENTEDFYGLHQEMQGGVDVFFDEALTQGMSADLLNQITPTLASILPNDAELTAVPELNMTGTEPFIYVSDLPPAGSAPRLRLDDGVVELHNARDELMFTGGELNRFTMAQIVTVGARNGLWLRPGDGPAPQPTLNRPLILNHGDVALIDEEGVALVTATNRNNLVQIKYPEQQSLWQVAERYRPWIVVGIWLILSLIVIRILRALYVKRQSSAKQ